MVARFDSGTLDGLGAQTEAPCESAKVEEPRKLPYWSRTSSRAEACLTLRDADGLVKLGGLIVEIVHLK
jgi:hypothetical protein